MENPEIIIPKKIVHEFDKDWILSESDIEALIS